VAAHLVASPEGLSSVSECYWQFPNKQIPLLPDGDNMVDEDEDDGWQYGPVG
jgi:hypothetical protein